jgi:hypothetical protein
MHPFQPNVHELFEGPAVKKQIKLFYGQFLQFFIVLNKAGSKTSSYSNLETGLILILTSRVLRTAAIRKPHVQFLLKKILFSVV